MFYKIIVKNIILMSFMRIMKRIDKGIKIKRLVRKDDGTVGCAVVVINGWVFSAIKNRKSYPSKYAQGNAIISSGMVLIMEIVNAYGDHRNSTGMLGNRHYYYSCKWWSVYLRATSALTALTVVEIFAEITMPAQNLLGSNGAQNFLSFKLRRGQLHLVIFIMTWLFTCLLSLPAHATYIFIQGGNGRGICLNVPLLGSEVMYILYDLVFATVVSFCPSFYMAYVLHSLKFRMAFLFFCKKIPPGMKSHIRKVRLAFFHMVFFMLTWMPMGVVLIARRFAKLSKSLGSSSFANAEYHWTVRLFFFLQFSCQPFLSIYAHFGLKLPRPLARIGSLLHSFIPRRKNQKPHPQNPHNPEEISISIVQMETVQPTLHFMAPLPPHPQRINHGRRVGGKSSSKCSKTKDSNET